MTGYSVEIKESSKELTAREKIAFKDFTNAIQIDNELKDESTVLTFQPAGYVILAVHNENSKNDKDYKKYLFIAKDGNKYVSGSESLFSAFMDIFLPMSQEAPDEDYSIEVYKRPSKNYSGKHFITCSMIA